MGSRREQVHRLGATHPVSRRESDRCPRGVRHDRARDAVQSTPPLRQRRRRDHATVVADQDEPPGVAQRDESPLRLDDGRAFHAELVPIRKLAHLAAVERTEPSPGPEDHHAGRTIPQRLDRVRDDHRPGSAENEREAVQSPAQELAREEGNRHLPPCDQPLTAAVGSDVQAPGVVERELVGAEHDAADVGAAPRPKSAV